MTAKSVLDQEKFWSVVNYLTELNEPKTFTFLCEHLGLGKWELNSFINFLNEIGFLAQVRSLNDDRVFTPPVNKPKLTMEFSLLEWIQFQAHFPKISECEEKPYHQGLKNKIIEAEERYKDHDLFSPAVTLDNILQEHQPSLLEGINNPSKEVLIFLEESIVDQRVVQLKLENKQVKVLPRKIVFFDGALNLIAEGVLDKCLLNINLNNIQNVYEESENYTEEFSRIEIEEFVNSLRSMTNSQMRLVLKVFSKKDFSLNFDQVYIDNPCLFTNPEGDFIWAATLEPSDEVFEWLCELGPAVEILDPTDFKLEFIKYCEHKLKKLA